MSQKRKSTKWQWMVSLCFGRIYSAFHPPCFGLSVTFCKSLLVKVLLFRDHTVCVMNSGGDLELRDTKVLLFFLQDYFSPHLC